MTQQPDEVPSVVVADIPPDAHLLDVREPDEWVAGHAPGAQFIPLGELPARLQEVPDDRRIFMVCRSGVRSAQATAYAAAHGRDAVNVAGGMSAWAAARRPMVSEQGGRPVVA